MGKVSRCTCIIETYSEEFATGTGFFVDPATLLTAKHVAPEKSTRVVAEVSPARIGVVDGILVHENLSEEMI